MTQLEETKEKIMADAEKLSRNKMELKKEVDGYRRGLQYMVRQTSPCNVRSPHGTAQIGGGLLMK